MQRRAPAPVEPDVIARAAACETYSASVREAICPSWRWPASTKWNAPGGNQSKTSGSGRAGCGGRRPRRRAQRRGRAPRAVRAGVDSHELNTRPRSSNVDRLVAQHGTARAREPAARGERVSATPTSWLPSTTDGGAEAPQQLAERRLAARVRKQVAGHADEVGPPLRDPLDRTLARPRAPRARRDGSRKGARSGPRRARVATRGICTSAREPHPAGLEPAPAQRAAASAAADDGARARGLRDGSGPAEAGPETAPPTNRCRRETRLALHRELVQHRLHGDDVPPELELGSSRPAATPISCERCMIGIGFSGSRPSCCLCVQLRLPRVQRQVAKRARRDHRVGAAPRSPARSAGSARRARSPHVPG